MRLYIIYAYICIFIDIYSDSVQLVTDACCETQKLIITRTWRKP